MGPARRIWVCALCFTVLLGCRKEAPDSVKAGQPFAEEKAPPFKSVVYFYWPAEQKGQHSQLLVGPCDGSLGARFSRGATLRSS
jgi:hypothetical protein